MSTFEKEVQTYLVTVKSQKEVSMTVVLYYISQF
jgi:hypothetical protein